MISNLQNQNNKHQEHNLILLIQDKLIIAEQILKDEEMEITQASLNMEQVVMKKIQKYEGKNKVLKVLRGLEIAKKVVGVIIEMKLIVIVVLGVMIQNVEMKTNVENLQTAEKELIIPVQILMKIQADRLHLTGQAEIRRNLEEKRDSLHITMALE